MFGKNPKRPPLKGDGSQLDIQHIFPTLQGEGPYAGWPAVFIRLGGCNLACAFCDTEFEEFKPTELDDVLAQVDDAAHATTQLVVITGGEPLRQPITPLCEALLERGFMVQVETNGTLWRNDLPEEVEIICSPKCNDAGEYAPIRPDLLERTLALKFLISSHHAGYGAVAEVGQSAYGTPVYVQPMDEYDPAKNKANQALAVKLAQENGYILSLQTHKLLGLE